MDEKILKTRYITPYITFWLAITIVFEALFLLTPDINLQRAVIAGLQIIGLAALLGFGVLRFAMISPMLQDDRTKCIALHSIGAMIYTVLWIGGVSLTGAIWSLVSSGVFDYRMPSGPAFRWHLVAGPILYAAIVTAIFSVRSFERSQDLIKKAELKALRAKLNPHFIFNTLHTIMMLFRSDAEKAEKAMEQFSDLIRYSFHGNIDANKRRDHVQLKDEWNIAKKYLELEKLRLDDKLWIELLINEQVLSYQSPRLLLQPLIENAVIHGASDREEGAKLRINMAMKSDRIEINIENDCVFSDYSRGTGLGLAGVKAGLENMFGSDFSMTYGTGKNNWYYVAIEMPALGKLPDDI